MLLQKIDWQKTIAAIWFSYSKTFKAARRIDPICLQQLFGIDEEKHILATNTEQLLNKKQAHHVLLRGSRGCGKSSLVKAMLNQYADDGLRLVYIDVSGLILLQEIFFELQSLPYSFIVFCDDLALELNDASYRIVKSVLDGSIELPPENVKLYATTNRKKILAHHHLDNTIANVSRDGGVQYSDDIEERISLLDRFGIWLTFYPIGQEIYLQTVAHIAVSLQAAWQPTQKSDVQKALLFARNKGVMNARVARNFIDSLIL